MLAILRDQVQHMRDADPRLPHALITMESSLTTDLGFDSISLVELACAVEQALNIDALPLQAWLGDESERGRDRYSVAAFLRFTLSHAGQREASPT